MTNRPVVMRKGGPRTSRTRPKIPMPPLDASWGPAMAALPSEQHRAFVLALWLVPASRGGPHQRGGASEALRLSGLHPNANQKTINENASRLMSDPRIQRAIVEESWKHMRRGLPPALKALDALVDDPKHKDHARAVGMVLDRVLPVTVRSEVQVDHTHLVAVAPAEVMRRIREIAARCGVEVEPESAKMIDVTPAKAPE